MMNRYNWLFLINFMMPVFAYAGDFWQALLSYDNEALTNILIEGRASPHEVSEDGITALHVAAYLGYLPTVKTLLNFGADVNQMNHFGIQAKDLKIVQDAFGELIEEEAAEFLCSLRYQAPDENSLETTPRKRARKFENTESNDTTAGIEQNMPKLHPKINRNILKDRNLIDKSQWKQAGMTQRVPNRVSRKHSLINRQKVSLLNSRGRSAIAVHPGKEAVLGEGKLGKVKPGQLIREGHSPWLEGHKDGDWVAIKFQHEQFEDEELEGLRRARRLIGSPVPFANKKGEARFAVPVELVEGVTLWEWLETQDPHQKWSFDKFKAVGEMIDGCLREQVHSKLMAFQDNNLDNILVNEESGAFTVVDFGNVFLFDNDGRENIQFEALCDDDFIRLRTSVFEFLQEKDYPEALQNLYWVSLFIRASEHMQRYGDVSSFSSARELLDGYYVSWPRLFTDVYDAEDLADLSDEEISSYCRKFLS